ncbi:protein FAR1-RELATED SEQUENCE 5-like [Olea europaea var. sylvestris]|uniref:protein FAR1-RELATED SEQUENCE 5-like n=1 Tax=Olea europaea var. sylvestris TaxID=158386 RepID=UPI000C1D6EF7|nr:protein FAR1-RELATED SEQUENCE 5-like [Olea europaea var. sylvestris]
MEEILLEQKYIDIAIYEEKFERMFTSREALIDWVKTVGKRYNMIVVMKKSDFGQVGRKPRIDFACERHGSYRCRNTNKENEKRKRRRTTETKKCGCPFLLNGRKLINGDYWILKVKCGRDNHDIAQNLEGHSYARRLTEKETSILVDMSKNHVRPKKILYTLKQNDDTNVSTMRHIYKARQKFMLKEQAGRTQMQQLMNRLVENKYIELHRTYMETNIVQDLFWAQPYSIDLLWAFPRVIIMDCTYKTNRYRLPLLEIVGVISTDLTFSIAFAYLGKEREENYAWALGRLKSLMNDIIMPSVIVIDRELALMKAIEKIFPTSTNILCRWHISKNVLAKTKKYFDNHKDQWDAFMHMWNLLVLSTSIEEYKQNLNIL